VSPSAATRRIALVSTGGTIEKTYDELSGVLKNEVAVLDVMLARLELRGVALERVRLMNKDSLDMSAADHELIAGVVGELAQDHDGVVVVHGTDRLAISGDACCARLGTPRVPVVFTGAMRPYELRSTDALQNLTEALLAVQILPPGVYVAMHNQVLRFPGVTKDRDLGTFVKAPASPMSLASTWDAVVDAYLEVNVPHLERYARDALRLCPVAPGARVLDVAAGPGTLALLAAPTASHVAAVDFAPAMVQALERRVRAAGVAHVQPMVADGQALPFGAATFDAAYSMFGLMFFPDRARGFAELARVLVPGGKAVVSSWAPMERVPLFPALIEALATELPQFQGPPPPPALTRPEDYQLEMAPAGFTVEVHEVSHALENADLAGLWRDVQRLFPPVVLVARRLGAAWAPVAERVQARLSERLGTGAQRHEMPAFIAVGTRR
jgi:ubiquinone/menaquinone biosynthesis C-methylase UbiE